MSVGGNYSPDINRAVQYAIQNGVVVVAAAGNQKKNACSSSPGSVGAAIIVGATDVYDNFASGFSNHGPCVDILAPGKDIWSIGSNSAAAVRKMSGTSMATPHGKTFLNSQGP